MQGARSSWSDTAARLLKDKGFTVSRVEESFRVLDGGRISRVKLVAFKGGEVKVSIFDLGGGRVHLTILASLGPSYDKADVIDTAESLGGSVEVDEDIGRLLIVFKSLEAEKVGAVLDSLL